MRTFDESFAEHRLTPDERAALVWHLAEIRTRKLVETLLPTERPRTRKKRANENSGD